MRQFGIINMETVNSVIETEEGGFLLIGESNYRQDKDIFIVKTTNEGIKEWETKLVICPKCHRSYHGRNNTGQFTK